MKRGKAKQERGGMETEAKRRHQKQRKCIFCSKEVTRRTHSTSPLEK